MENIKLKPYQQKCSDLIKTYKHCFLKMETGAGKTFTALFSVDSDTIVIVQNKAGKEQWEKSIALLNFDFKIDVFTNYELSNNLDLKNKRYTYFDPFKYNNLIFDETQGITNPKSTRSKKCKKIFKHNKYEKIIAMTYTPIRKNEVDIYTIIKNLDMNLPLKINYPNLEVFHNEFFWYHDKWNFKTGKVEPVPDEFNILKQDLFNSCINIINYEFPDEEKEGERQFIKHKWYIPLQKKNMDLYNYVYKSKVLKGYHNTLGGATKYMKLQEIANSTLKLTFENKVTDNDYLQKLEITDKILLRHKRIILIYQFENEYKLLKSYYKNGTKQIKAFDKENSKFNVLFRNIKMCATMDVMSTDTIVFFSMNFSADNFIQMHGRVTRTSSKFIDVYFYYLVFENTIEKDRYEVCLKKKSKNDVLRSLE